MKKTEGRKSRDTVPLKIISKCVDNLFLTVSGTLGFKKYLPNNTPFRTWNISFVYSYTFNVFDTYTSACLHYAVTFHVFSIVQFPVFCGQIGKEVIGLFKFLLYTLMLKAQCRAL
jgi:hypothetical protein